MSNHIKEIMNEKTGRIVMLAVDHGYFQGPTSGLEEPGKTIEPLLPYCDAVSPTKGVFLRCMPPESKTPVISQGFGRKRHRLFRPRGTRTRVEHPGGGPCG